MNSSILETKDVFDVSKLIPGSVIEIVSDNKDDLIKRNAIVIKTGLDKLECVYVDPETKKLEIEKIFLYELSNETHDGYTVNLLAW